ALGALPVERLVEEVGQEAGADEDLAEVPLRLAQRLGGALRGDHAHSPGGGGMGGGSGSGAPPSAGGRCPGAGAGGPSPAAPSSPRRCLRRLASAARRSSSSAVRTALSISEMRPRFLR